MEADTEPDTEAADEEVAETAGEEVPEAAGEEVDEAAGPSKRRAKKDYTLPEDKEEMMVQWLQEDANR